jgi:hypothetical protein
MYIPQNWKFGPAFSKLRNFGGGGGVLTPQTTPLGMPVLATNNKTFNNLNICYGNKQSMQ